MSQLVGSHIKIPTVEFQTFQQWAGRCKHKFPSGPLKQWMPYGKALGSKSWEVSWRFGFSDFCLGRGLWRDRCECPFPPTSLFFTPGSYLLSLPGVGTCWEAYKWTHQKIWEMAVGRKKVRVFLSTDNLKLESSVSNLGYPVSNCTC